MHKRGLGLVALIVLFLGLPATTASAAPGNGKGAKPDDPAVAFWTHAKVAKAVSRDFVYDPATGRFSPGERGKPAPPGGGGGGGGGGGASTSTTGTSWPNGSTAVRKTTGKVLFAMAGTYYVCSASTAGTKDGASVVVTAGHCVYDETNGGYATNWVFIPDYDSAPAPLSTSNSSYCADTAYGCWSARTMYVDDHFANAGGFNDNAIPYDFGFVRLNPGGKTNSEADQVVGTQAIQYTAITGQQGFAFGYPAAGKYHGSDLVYCAGTVGTDPNAANATYRLGCDMTGGSSGGPWMASFNTSTGTGVLSSVNSYGYSGVRNMYGPKFNSAAEALYTAASA